MQFETSHYHCINVLYACYQPQNQSKKPEEIPKTTNLCISTHSMSPEKEKNSLMSCSVAPKETLLTLTVVICKKRNEYLLQPWKGMMLTSMIIPDCNNIIIKNLTRHWLLNNLGSNTNFQYKTFVIFRVHLETQWNLSCHIQVQISFVFSQSLMMLLQKPWCFFHEILMFDPISTLVLRF